jgi:hypothetical protein
MAMKLVAAAALLFVAPVAAGATVPQAPQAPFAAGPFESILGVARAATRCGVHRMRLETGQGWAKPSHARLFYDEPVNPEVEHCVTHWTTKEGVRLGLEPRWWGDAFEGDAPRASTPR